MYEDELRRSLAVEATGVMVVTDLNTVARTSLTQLIEETQDEVQIIDSDQKRQRYIDLGEERRRTLELEEVLI